jgi:hypothetical protein
MTLKPDLIVKCSRRQIVKPMLRSVVAWLGSRTAPSSAAVPVQYLKRHKGESAGNRAVKKGPLISILQAPGNSWGSRTGERRPAPLGNPGIPRSRAEYRSPCDARTSTYGRMLPYFRTLCQKIKTFVPQDLGTALRAESWRRIEAGKNKSSGGLPFLSRPRRFSWGLSSTSMLAPSPL